MDKVRWGVERKLVRKGDLLIVAKECQDISVGYLSNGQVSGIGLI